jgi:nicotinate-nucleotide--dimethylbenzimidazole phosphoribosyltransferase
LRRKVDVVRRGLELHGPDPADPVGVLAAVGGFEIGVLAGVALGAGARGVPVLIDGVITGAAALLAARLAPALTGRLIASHHSPEPAHTLQLRALGLVPLLDLGLRLGEGSGAALALPLVRASLAILEEMATFEAAGVTDAGR